MNILIAHDYEDLSAQAAELVVEQIKNNPETVLGLPTGKTPLGLYRRLAEAYRSGRVSFARVKTFNLDDYVGVPRTCQDSFYAYMKKNLFGQVDIKPENIFLLDGTAANLSDECANYERHLDEVGGLDLAILGIGLDGHLAFCEPGTSFYTRTLAVDLAESTRQANAADLLELAETPPRAVTIGLGTLMKSRRLLLLASGAAKAAIVARALHGAISEQVPASILQTHSDVTAILDQAAAGQ